MSNVVQGGYGCTNRVAGYVDARLGLQHSGLPHRFISACNLELRNTQSGQQSGLPDTSLRPAIMGTIYHIPLGNQGCHITTFLLTIVRTRPLSGQSSGLPATTFRPVIKVARYHNLGNN